MTLTVRDVFAKHMTTEQADFCEEIGLLPDVKKFGPDFTVSEDGTISGSYVPKRTFEDLFTSQRARIREENLKKLAETHRWRKEQIVKALQERPNVVSDDILSIVLDDPEFSTAAEAALEGQKQHQQTSSG